ncbi:MAG: methyl-accepting chemotaxis protein, partial [Candidatus Omnitrophica bacterium]|nr:methyl-accepting chemotaxis protein [Candidatus Omnitrophota bacterium]
AGGNLDATIPVTSHDEAGELAKAFNRMLWGLKQIMVQVNIVGTEMTSAATQISASTREQAKGSTEQSSAVNQASTTVKELAATASQIKPENDQLQHLLRNYIPAVKIIFIQGQTLFRHAILPTVP